MHTHTHDAYALLHQAELGVGELLHLFASVPSSVVGTVVWNSVAWLLCGWNKLVDTVCLQSCPAHNTRDRNAGCFHEWAFPPAKGVIIKLKFLSILESKVVCTVSLCFVHTPFINLNMDC